VYKKEWKGMGDWLGTGNIAPQDRKYRPFLEAREFVHSLGLKTTDEWREYCKSDKRPNDIPQNVKRVYKDDWKGMGDWLGTGRIADKYKVFRSFEKAIEFVHSLGLGRHEEWEEYSKSGNKPIDIPAAPGNNINQNSLKSLAD
jgi:hypothetical protein